MGEIHAVPLACAIITACATWIAYGRGVRVGRRYRADCANCVHYDVTCQLHRETPPEGVSPKEVS